MRLRPESILLKRDRTAGNHSGPSVGVATASAPPPAPSRQTEVSRDCTVGIFGLPLSSREALLDVLRHCGHITQLQEGAPCSTSHSSSEQPRWLYVTFGTQYAAEQAVQHHNATLVDGQRFGVVLGRTLKDEEEENELSRSNNTSELRKVEGSSNPSHLLGTLPHGSRGPQQQRQQQQQQHSSSHSPTDGSTALNGGGREGGAWARRSGAATTALNGQESPVMVPKVSGSGILSILPSVVRRWATPYFVQRDERPIREREEGLASEEPPSKRRRLN